MDVVAVPDLISRAAEDYFRLQGWHVAYAQVPGRRPVMVRERFNEAVLGECLAEPWGGGFEMAGTGQRPIGACLRRHLHEGGLALSLRSDTAYDLDLAQIFVAALRARLIDPESDTTDLEFVIHEMVTNALLHGNLAIECRMVDGDGDLERFGRRIDEALASPAAARRLQLSASLVDDRLEVAVEDDGAGYDQGRVQSDPIRPHGLTLVAEAASSLRVEEGGRRAVAVFSVKPRRSRSTPENLAAAHVLVVDDNPLNRAVMVALLRGMGVGRIEEAIDGREGLEAISRQKPDMVLLDVMMPKMDGFEMCRRLRRIHPLTALPVIFVTALDGPGDRAACFAAGGSDMVSKPIDTTEVIARVGVHLQVGMLVDRLRTFQERVYEELQAARGAQIALAPTPERIAQIQRRTGLEVEGLIETSSELGGDFWTLLDAGPGRLGLVVADFSGHGPVAAFNVFRLHLLLSRLPRMMPSPSRLLDLLNRELRALLKPGQFAAVFAGLIDIEAGTLTYASAAAPQPVLVTGGRAQALDAAGPPLGAFEDARFDDTTVAMPAGAALLVYSDALIESEADGRPVCDEATLIEWAETAEPGRGLAAEILGRFHQVLPGGPPDDLTLVCIRRP